MVILSLWWSKNLLGREGRKHCTDFLDDLLLKAGELIKKPVNAQIPDFF
jgi:hypothetical protein